jgi:hypothetical protein
MDFADPSQNRTRPNGVGYRFCFVGRAIGSGWQGPPNFREWGGPIQGSSKQGLDGLACPTLSPERPFRLGEYSNSKLAVLRCTLEYPHQSTAGFLILGADGFKIGAWMIRQ